MQNVELAYLLKKLMVTLYNYTHDFNLKAELKSLLEEFEKEAKDKDVKKT